MWQMTLKQRRRHRELMDLLSELKSHPHLQVTEDYEPGLDPEEDAKREATIEKFKRAMEEVHEIEEAARLRS